MSIYLGKHRENKQRNTHITLCVQYDVLILGCSSVSAARIQGRTYRSCRSKLEKFIQSVREILQSGSVRKHCKTFSLSFEMSVSLS